MKLAPLNTLTKAHDDSIWTAVWVPETGDCEPLLLTGSLDETVRLWNPEGPEILRTNTGHSLGVVSVAAHPSGRIAASASIDCFVRVFDVVTNNTIAALEAPPSEVWQLKFNPTGTILAAAGGSSSSIKLWNTTEYKSTATLELPRPTDSSSKHFQRDKFALSIAWSPDGQHIACGVKDGTIAIFDTVTSKFLHYLQGHAMPVRSLVYSSSPLDSRVLYSASDDGYVHMYDSLGKSLITSLSGHSGWVLSVDVSPDGMALATGSSDRTVRLWDVKMRMATQVLMGHTDQVWAVCFGPALKTDSRSCLLATVSDDQSLSFYNYS